MALEPPDRLQRRFPGCIWKLAWTLIPQVVTYRLESTDRQPVAYVKLTTAGWPGMREEADRLRWLSSFLPVPEVLEMSSDSSVAWLVTRPLPGLTAIDPALGMAASEMAGALGRGLRKFHDTLPVSGCPFVRTNDVEMKRLRGTLDSAPFHSLFTAQPEREDLVVSHGDACLPNFLLESGEVAGYLDVGDLGVADRWRDVAVMIWSLERNLGPGLDDHLLDGYGWPREESKLRFYQALYFAD